MALRNHDQNGFTEEIVNAIQPWSSLSDLRMVICVRFLTVRAYWTLSRMRSFVVKNSTSALSRDILLDYQPITDFKPGDEAYVNLHVFGNVW